jgi:DNA polymerase II large subunit
MTKLAASPEYSRYFCALQGGLNSLYEVACRAREKGLDPKLKPEPKITIDIAERVEQLVGPMGVGARIRELSESMDRREMAFKIAEEVVYGRFGHLEPEKAADQAVRTALAILTEGITIAPTQGVTEVKFKANSDGTRYLAIYFAGPIRPAGGTAQALTLVVGDFIRKKLGLDRYKPSEKAVMRFAEEVRLYERKVRRFQYHVTDEDLHEALRSLPVEATGVGTEPFEVSSFRDIPGIETNRVRGGALIVVVDGVVGRAKKLLGTCEKLHIEDWGFLSQMGEGTEGENSAKFMDEIIVGRPVFSFPSTVGGFRLRYGRARDTGLAAVGVHPATMITLKRFLVTGVQLRIELPGKSAIVTPVDAIEPPVVRLRGGSVVRVETVEEAEKLEGSVERILFVGDVLVNVGDFLQNNIPLLPSGYDESRWRLDLKEALKGFDKAVEAKTTGISSHKLLELLNDPLSWPSAEEAVSLSESLGVPLHPRYTYLWSSISSEEVLRLRNYLLKAERVRRNDSWVLIGALDAEVKGLLEKLLIPHVVSDGRLVFSEITPVLERCLALERSDLEINASPNSLELVCRLSGFEVKEKAPVFVGARMGRPEKAKERMLEPYVHVLFPVGNAGGAQRDIVKAAKGAPIAVELMKRLCPRCGRLVFGAKCPDCGVDAVSENVCPRCGRPVNGSRCPACNVPATSYSQVRIDLGRLLEEAQKRSGSSLPEIIKGVKGLMNGERVPETLEKGILRAKYDLSIFKDGTIRFDVTDAPLTHFKPVEIGVSPERLRELGYAHDRYGRSLESPEQMLELKIQDIIVPEKCGDYLVKVAKFLDEELIHLYGLAPIYKVERRDDLIGALVMGLAPHTSAAILGRIIGFTHALVCYAHPLWHAAKRRNCDGDEDAILLALDPLLNFSEAFLPDQIGGMMDAPLFIIPVVIPSEVDKEAHNVDVMDFYPPALYKEAQKQADPSDYGRIVDTIGTRLGTEAQFQGFGYTVECSNINLGSHEGAYTHLGTMLEKLEAQLELSEQLEAVDVKTVAMGILTSHFLKDIVGNLRAFTSQSFRCMSCNRRYRRIPLSGKCPRCGGNISLTVYQGGIEKYVESASKLVDRYDLGNYYLQRIQLVKDELDSLFQKKPVETKAAPRQVDLKEFLRRP